MHGWQVCSWDDRKHDYISLLVDCGMEGLGSLSVWDIPTPSTVELTAALLSNQWLQDRVRGGKYQHTLQLQMCNNPGFSLGEPGYDS